MSRIFYVPYPYFGRLKCGKCFRGNIDGRRLRTRCKVCKSWNRTAHQE